LSSQSTQTDKLAAGIIAVQLTERVAFSTTAKTTQHRIHDQKPLARRLFTAAAALIHFGVAFYLFVGGRVNISRSHLCDLREQLRKHQAINFVLWHMPLARRINLQSNFHFGCDKVISIFHPL